MDMQYHGNSQQAPTAEERRRFEREKKSGRLISISGSRARAALQIPLENETEHMFWSVGDLIAIYGQNSRVVCLAQDMATAQPAWNGESGNLVHANLEVIGEIVDVDGAPKFRRGIRFYPGLGALVGRIRKDDLVSIYDLGAIEATSIGTLVQASHILAKIDVEKMLHRHFAVVGTTGVGKSCSVSILVKAAVKSRKQLRVVILDPHNEYSHAFKNLSKTIPANELEIPFWLFQIDEFVEALYRGPAPAEEVDIIREAISHAKDASDLSERSGSVLKKTFRAQTESNGGSEVKIYRLNDLMAFIEQELGRLEPRFSRLGLRAVKSRIELASNDVSYRFMFGKASIDGNVDCVMRSMFRMQDERCPITILQLAGIPSDIVNASVSVLARLAFDQSVRNAGKYEILLLCEEAHRYAPADASLGFAPTRRALARIAKEGRKYGCCVSIVTQRPSELDQTILSQCSSIFAMRLSNALDQDIIRKAIPDNSSGVLEFISSLSNREAIAFGEAVATPMRLMFDVQDESVLPRMAGKDAVDAADPIQAEDELAFIRGTSPYEARAPIYGNSEPQRTHHAAAALAHGIVAPPPIAPSHTGFGRRSETAALVEPTQAPTVWSLRDQARGLRR